VSLTDWASCPQQVTLVMMRPIVSTAQSMSVNWTFFTWLLRPRCYERISSRSSRTVFLQQLSVLCYGIRKHVVDFLLVLTELFTRCYGWGDKGENRSRIGVARGWFSICQIFMQKGTSPPITLQIRQPESCSLFDR